MTKERWLWWTQFSLATRSDGFQSINRADAWIVYAQIVLAREDSLVGRSRYDPRQKLLEAVEAAVVRYGKICERIWLRRCLNRSRMWCLVIRSRRDALICINPKNGFSTLFSSRYAGKRKMSCVCVSDTCPLFHRQWTQKNWRFQTSLASHFFDRASPIRSSNVSEFWFW